MDEIDVRTSFNVHDDLKHLSVPDLRTENEKSRLPFAVCAWNVDGNLNIGMMIRSACNMGAERFIVIGRRHYDKRSCVGSNHYLDVQVVNGYDFNRDLYDAEAFWKEMERWGYTPIFLETFGTPINTSFDLEKYTEQGLRPCLVFGSESKGIPQEIVNDSRAEVVAIPQVGVIRSYNVSAAAAIAMWELVRSTL